MNPIDMEQRLGELVADMLKNMSARKAGGATAILIPEGLEDGESRPLVTVTVTLVNKDNIDETVGKLMRGKTEETPTH
jgi:hypothetical protein